MIKKKKNKNRIITFCKHKLINIVIKLQYLLWSQNVLNRDMTLDLNFRKILITLRSMVLVQVSSGGDGGEICWRQGDRLLRKTVALVQKWEMTLAWRIPGL